MKILLLPLVITSLLITGCSKDNNTDSSIETAIKDKVVEKAIQKAEEKIEEISESPETEEVVAKEKIASYNFDGEFDWSKIPVSTANIGSFPYISTPEGMSHWKSDSSDQTAPADQPYTTYWDFNKLIMFDGNNVIHAEGKRAFLYAKMTDDSDFLELKFAKSVKDYLKSIGAVEIFNDHLPKEVTDKLNEKDDMTVYTYITGDVWNKPISQYALNHASGKIFFQVLNDSAHGEIGVVELEGFEQTIKAPTASEIKQQLDADGKAVLHINFDTGKASIKAESQPIVEQINLLLTQNPDMKISIEGHTDNVGDSTANQKLSENRANTVMYALAGKGIDVSRLSAKGFGDTAPIADNGSDEGKAENRRVELVKF